jgi:3-hydroxyisobutyrate dehydrogenase-like beta-hydroxyacid dehydrogenase
MSETIGTVAVMSPGDMGHAIGRTLRAGGRRVITCLEGRSARTAALAAAAGIEAVPDDATLVREADALLAVLVPSEAAALGERIAAALERTGASLLYADLNAISPRTVQGIGMRLEAAGARFVDGGIIGGPPHPASRLDSPPPPEPRPKREGPRIYVSGADAPELAQLSGNGLTVRVLGERIGEASGLKMCYAALTKGVTALATELLVAAEVMGLAAPLRAELEGSQGGQWAALQRGVAGMPPKAYRWVGEMEEIAATFADCGLTPRLLEGAADVYRLVARSPLGEETPEVRRRGTTAEDAVAVLAATLRQEATLPAR